MKLIDTIKGLYRRLMNKSTAFRVLRSKKPVNVRMLESPVAPSVIHKAPKLNMGFNPKNRGKTGISQFHAKGGSWYYNPHFISFLRVVVNMDAFPVQFLNGKTQLLVEETQLIEDLELMGHNDYVKTYNNNLSKFEANGIIAISTKDDIRFVYINEWDMFIAAIDAFTMFKL